MSSFMLQNLPWNIKWIKENFEETDFIIYFVTSRKFDVFDVFILLLFYQWVLLSSKNGSIVHFAKYFWNFAC